MKIKNPALRLEQDISYNEALVMDIQTDIDDLQQQKNEKESILKIYQNISKKIKMKNKDIRTIQQLRYNISKVKSTELKKKLMNMLRTYKMFELTSKNYKEEIRKMRRELKQLYEVRNRYLYEEKMEAFNDVLKAINIQETKLAKFSKKGYDEVIDTHKDFNRLVKEGVYRSYGV